MFLFLCCFAYHLMYYWLIPVWGSITTSTILPQRLSFNRDYFIANKRVGKKIMYIYYPLDVYWNCQGAHSLTHIYCSRSHSYVLLFKKVINCKCFLSMWNLRCVMTFLMISRPPALKEKKSVQHRLL